MADQKLLIEINAKVDDATKQISKVNQSLGSMPKAAEAASAGIKKLGNVAGQSNVALTNFGRVIQDAPFGIIGIANNIDPLISSLQNLGKTARESGTSAFRELGKALLGPAGIAIAVSAVTSILIKYGAEIGRAISGLSNLEVAQREAAEGGAQAFAKASDEIGNFVRIANDSGNSLARQNDALKDTNALLDDYGLRVTDLATLQKSGAQIGALYAQIKQEEAKATILAGKAAEAYAKQVALGIKAQQGDIAILSDFSIGDLFNTALSGASGGAATASAVVDGYSNAVGKAKSEEALFNAETLKVRTNIDTLIKSLGSINGVTEDFGTKTKSATKSSTELNQAYVFETASLTQLTKAGVGQTTALGQLAAAIDKVREAQDKKNLADKAAALIAATSGTQTAPGDLANRLKQPTAITEKQAEIAAQGAANVERLQIATQNTNAAFALLSPAIDQAFNALANGENAAEAVKQALKQMIVQLVKAVAQALILSAILNAIAPGSSAASGGFSGIFKGLLGFKAKGGPVSGGGSYIVGENGPELFTPGRGGTIIPNGNLAMAGGGGGTVEFEIRGDVLFGLLKKNGINRAGTF